MLMLIEEQGAYHLERATMISKLATNGEIRDYMQVDNTSIHTSSIVIFSTFTKPTKDIAENSKMAPDSSDRSTTLSTARSPRTTTRSLDHEDMATRTTCSFTNWTFSF